MSKEGGRGKERRGGKLKGREIMEPSMKRKNVVHLRPHITDS